MIAKSRRIIAIATALLGAGISVMPGARAGTAADFYKGKTVTILIGFAVGGGADVFARAFAPYFAKAIPGRPTVIVQNMPGAGGIKALNLLYNAPPQDGTRLMLTSPSHTLAYLMGRKGVRYDINKLKWIGTLTQDTPSCVASGSSGITSITQTSEKPLIVGGTGPDSSSAQHAYLLAHMFGYKLKVVPGYTGTARIRLAMQSGEVQAVCAFWASSALGPQREEIVSGALVPIVQMGTRPVPVFGKAPVVYDLARNDDERKMLRVVFGTTELSRPFAAPPGTPDAELAALRSAFWTSVNSAEFKAAATRARIIVDPLNWQDTEAAFKEILGTPKKLVEKTRELIAK
jgi:tripartite-type tricarboxylate transporter receptor subunit TctC